MLRLIAPAVALAAAATLIAPTVTDPAYGAGAVQFPSSAHLSRPTQLRTIATYDFSKGETPENVAVAPDGTVYLTLIVASTLEIRRPHRPVERVKVDTAGGTLAGVALDRLGNVWVDVSSPDGAVAGIYRLRQGSPGPASPERIAALPATGLANGMAFDPAGNLYVVDSALGVVYRLARGAREVTVWAGGPELSQDTTQGLDGITFPGPNGIKVFRGAVYVSNSSRYNVLRIPIRRDGSAARTEIRYPGVVADDFAFDIAGNLYVTTDPFQTVERVTPDGTRTVLATKADGLDGPSAVAFGVGHHRTDLYVTNLGFFGTDHHPSLQILPVGVPGAKLP